MDKKYFSVKIKTSGPTPGKYSLLSIGVCLVGDRQTRFYREIQPITATFIPDAIRSCAKGFECLKDVHKIPEYNPQSDKFQPEKVLDALSQRAIDPETAMREYAEWISCYSKELIPIEVASPIKYVGMFTSYYFDNFHEGLNPFGQSGEDLASFYRGVQLDPDSHLYELMLRNKEPPNNALKDAILQAKECEEIFRLMNLKR